MDWTDMFFHAVDPDTKAIVPVNDILNEIDSKFDFLKDYYSVSSDGKLRKLNVCALSSIIQNEIVVTLFFSTLRIEKSSPTFSPNHHQLESLFMFFSPISLFLPLSFLH